MLVARLTAREHDRIFLLCHYFASTNYERTNGCLMIRIGGVGLKPSPPKSVYLFAPQ
jgi:hypothetical protein